MSEAIRRLHSFLAKSPSVVYPEDVLAYLPAIEAENAKLLDEKIDAYNAKVEAQLEADELRAENAKLRDERDHYKALWEHIHVTDAELRRVRAAWKKDREQIAKLRELVHGLDHCAAWADEDGKDCWSCPLWHEKDCTVEDIERELGIEDNT